jgi:uncharacterized glyoxalase superfamily protein PhnB
MKQCTLNIMVDDMERTVEFYQNMLGFEVLTTVPQAKPWTWALLRQGNVEVMFQARRSKAESLPLWEKSARREKPELHMEVQGVKALYERVQSKAADIVRTLQAPERGSQEFSLRDCNDFVLTFAQR